MKYLFTLIIFAQTSIAFSQTAATIDYSILIGTWKVLSKIEIKKSDGQVIGQNKNIYKPEEKTFEFSPNGTVNIVQDFGKNSEELPASIQGKNLYIGKIKKTKVPYLVRYDGKLLKLAKTEGKIKKGRTILETEEVILERK